MSLLTSAFLVLADTPPADIDPSTGKGPEWGKAAPIGLLVLLLMGIAVFFLLRSMVRNLKKVPDSFDPPPENLPDELAVDDAPLQHGEPETGSGPGGLVNERSG